MIIAIEANSAASSIMNGDIIKGAVRHCYNHADIASRHWLAVVYDDGSDDALTTDIPSPVYAFWTTAEVSKAFGSSEW